MFEREIKFIYDFNLNKVKQLGAHFTYQGLSTAQLHPAILKYISAEIDYLIYEDRQHLLRNSSFDYSGDEINKYFLLINEEIKKEKKLAFDYVDQLVLQAASFTANYLVQPSWSLSKLIFDKEETIPVPKAKQIINYIYYYDYIKTITESYFRKKNLVNLNKAEFESLLEKIDREVFGKYSEKILDKVLYSMGDFFNIGNMHKTKVPLSAVELFLIEKKMENYTQRISDAFYPEPKYTYDITEIRKILYSSIPVKKDKYLDRVIKQDTPDSVFKAPVIQQIEENPVPDNTEVQTQTEAKTSKEDILEPENEVPEEDTAGIEESIPVKREEEISREPIPKEEEIIQEPIEDETHSLLVNNVENIEPSVNEEINQPHNPTEEHPENIFSDKEDPGNLDFTPESHEDKTIQLEIPELDDQDKTTGWVDTESKDIPGDETIIFQKPEAIQETEETISDDDTIIIETINEPDIEPETQTPGTVEIPKIEEELRQPEHIQERMVHSAESVKEPEQERSNEEEDFIDEPLTPWTLKKETKDLSSFLSGKDMDRMIKNIFNEDAEDFAVTFEKLADCRTEEQAISILDRVLKSNGVKPASKDALLFRKIINEYFNQ